MSEGRCGDISDVPWQKRLEAWLKNPPPAKKLPLSAEDIEILLPLAVDDALRDKDVISRYPALFQAMVDDDELAQRFLLAVGMLEEDAAAEDISPSTVDMDAIRRYPAPPQLSMDAARRWRIQWHKLKEQLSAVLFPPRAQNAPVMRGTEEPAPRHVLQETVSVDGLEVDVALILEQSLENPEQAAVTLLAATTPERQELTLEATVKWGDYEDGGRIDRYGLLALAPLTLSTVIDCTQQQVLRDLDLSLAVVSR